MDPVKLPTGDARHHMVDGQLRPNRVTDRQVLKVMRALEREAFLPDTLAPRAYADAEIPLAPGRAMLMPLVAARLLQAVALQPGETVLVLGAGYLAAACAKLGATVTAVEDSPPLLALARAGCARAGCAVTLIEADPAAGHPPGAPYDAILIDGGADGLPPLAAQLRADPPGRLCAVVTGPGRSGVLLRAERNGATLTPRTLFDAVATRLPALTRAEGFRF